MGVLGLVGLWTIIVIWSAPAMVAVPAANAACMLPAAASAMATHSFTGATADERLVLFSDRRPWWSSRAVRGRRKGRTKAEVEREQRLLLERTEREVDAIAAEFHERLPRDKSQRIGLMYARYSSRFQSSVPAQVRALYETAVREGTFVPRELVFFDLAVRGYRDNRPGLNALRAALSAKQGKSLLVFGTNRLFRKAHRAVRFVEEEIVERGMRCFFIQQNIDTAANKDWRLHLMIQAAIDENGTSMYAENIRAAHQGMFLRLEVVGTLALGYCGEPIAGAPPTRRGRPRCRIAVDQEAARYIVQIFDWFVLEARSMDEIARLLNDDPHAPSPPKSMHGLWTHSSVRRVLTNARYRGYWEYGKQQSQYQSSKDYVRQVDREQPLQATFVESLRIISDASWYAAQSLLLEERGNQGRKTSDPARCTTPKILNGMLWCPVHDRALQVGAAHGSAMVCKLCKALKVENRPLYSQLDRALALRLTLEKLAALVRGDESLVAQVMAACRREAEAAQRPDPERLEYLKVQVAKKSRAIQINRRNPGETEEDQRESDQIVRQLRAERTQLQAEISQLETARQQCAEVPDDAEVQQLIVQLGTILTTAAQAIPPTEVRNIRRLVRMLTGGKIYLYQQGERRAKRGWLQGRFRVPLLSYLAAQVSGVPTAADHAGMEVTIDFRSPSPLDARANEAWQLRAEHLLNVEIAACLGCSRAMVTKLLKHAAALHSVPFVDGRQQRSERERKHCSPPLWIRLAPEVGDLVAQGLLLGDIATRLQVDRNTVTKAYNRYRQDQGLPPLDGRARRKLLGRKSREQRDDQQ